MINWDLIIKDFDLKGRYGHFLVISSSGRFLDFVFYHFDHFDYDPFVWSRYHPTLNPDSFYSRFYVVKSVKMNRNFLYFHSVIVLSKKNIFTRYLKPHKYQLNVHK